MSRYIIRWMLLFLLVGILPVSLSAQERATWSLEASINYLHQDYDYGEVHQAIDSRITHERVDLQDRTITNVQKIDPQWVPDLQIGFRYKNLHFGFIFSEVSEQTVGYESYVETAGGQHFQPYEYVITARAREYMLSLGYLHPLHPRISLGVSGAIGWGVASGKYNDPFGPPGTSSIEVDMEGDYTPIRLEGEARLHLTKYIDLNFKGGWRGSVADEMVADYGLTLGEYPVTVYSTSNSRIAEFSWSGMYYGVGLTLKNPYAKK